MKLTFWATLALTFSLPLFTYASTLETELNSLAIPQDQAAVSVAKDKLYSVQGRFSPLKNRHEFSLSLGKNVNQDGNLVSNQWGGIYRYHINDKWAVGGNYFRMNNELSSSGKKLLSDKGIVPDRDFITQQTDLMAEYNLFYGKLRFDMEQVTYFDQYIGLGAGQLSLGQGNATAAVVDLGIAFWIGKKMSARMGMKNDFYREQNLSGSTNVHNMVGYFAFGYLLGGNL
jgi:outer membrane beta-barrel protein